LDDRWYHRAVIISDTHRYLFIEQPHTACSAIRAELRELYGGEPMLEKHSTYADFLRVATAAQKRYFVFSGIRNPLDEAVSLYFKYRTDHHRQYSRMLSKQTLSATQRAAFMLVVEEDADFGHYLRRVYKRPFDNDTMIYHTRMDQIIRFEHLQGDFTRTLARLGLEQVRPLPMVNQTAERGPYLDYYPRDLRSHAAKIFGPFMQKWGYGLPEDWVGVTIPRAAVIDFRLRGILRYVDRRYLRRPANPAVRLASAVLMPMWRSATRRPDR
jgi:hypothetical protein